MTSLIWLDAVGGDDRARVGGKAFVLGRLRQAGFPVPDGFVLPAGAWGPEERAAAAAAFARIGGPVAVRSSGTAEDGDSASFAGQYLTLLDVRDEAALLDAIVRCREAAGRASAYAAALSAGTGTMAVLVQRFVEPQAAGVVFTRDPRDPSRLVVEAHRGRGEAVVSGQVTPARYSIPRAGGETRREGGEGALAEEQLQEVVALSNRVETHLGAPQDVEWAWDAAGVVLLQARPITVHEEATRDPRVRRLTRANVGEVLPGPVTPLTWSALCAYLEAAFVRIGRGLDVLPDDPPPFLVLHHRRLYFNLDLCVQMVTRMPGITPEDAERLILGGGATKGHAPALKGAPGWRTVRGGFSLAHSLPARIEEAERVVRGLPPSAAIERADAAGLVRMMDDVIARCLGVADTHVSTSGASAVTMALLARLLSRDGMGDPVERTGRLLAGLDGVDSVAPALALEAIAARARANPRWREWLGQPAARAADAFAHHDLPAEMETELRSFLERFGHRGLSEGDLSSRAWDEDPTPVFESLQALLKSERTPGFGPRARAEVRRADEEALFMRAGPAVRPILTRRA